MVMKAVPIARVVFVVRVPVLENEAKLTASVLLPSKDWMLSRSGPRRNGGDSLPDWPFCP